MTIQTRLRTRPAAVLLALLSAAPAVLAEDPPLGPFGGDRLRRENEALRTEAETAKQRAAQAESGKAEALAQAKKARQELADWQAKAQAADERARQAEAAQPGPALQACQGKPASRRRRWPGWSGGWRNAKSPRHRCRPPPSCPGTFPKPARNARRWSSCRKAPS